MTVAQTILAATHPILLIIEQVEHHSDPSYHEVTFSTTFSMVRYDHLTLHRAKVAFRCGDDRLLQEGAEWLAGVVWDDPPYVQEVTPQDLPRAFLVPGVLLPNYGYVRHVIDSLAYEISSP